LPLYCTLNTFITLSPGWLTTFTAMRPDLGLSKGWEVPRLRVAQIAYHPPEQLSVFSARHTGEQVFDVLQRTHGISPISRVFMAGKDIL
jgi:hypothetical protein